MQPNETASAANGSTRKERAAERRKLAAERARAVMQTDGLMRLPEVLAMVPVSASTWWEGIRRGRFPKGMSLGGRCTCWRSADIRALIESVEGGGQ